MQVELTPGETEALVDFLEIGLDWVHADWQNVDEKERSMIDTVLKVLPKLDEARAKRYLKHFKISSSS